MKGGVTTASLSEWPAEKTPQPAPVDNAANGKRKGCRALTFETGRLAFLAAAPAAAAAALLLLVARASGLPCVVRD